MQRKTVFTRLAARPNFKVSSPPPVLFYNGVTCHLNTLVHQFSQLTTKPDYQIVSNAGQVYASSERNRFKEEEMFAVSGDSSPLSYLQASVCYHELKRYSEDNSSDWQVDQIIDDFLISRFQEIHLWPFCLQMNGWNPIFFYDLLDHPVVIFYTYHSDVCSYVLKHTHRFAHTSYHQKVDSKVELTGENYSISWKRLS
ncbi:hypothetical protein [Halobacillus sp. B23F22_1]|uniref:hypothetical protein n=1 Tax=Halobacillus sp. B23F22_1 TaxID=3459514 RepID=UPI00373F496C